MQLSSSKRVAAAVVVFAMFQLLFAMIRMKRLCQSPFYNFNCGYGDDGSVAYSHAMSHPAVKNNTTQSKSESVDDTTTNTDNVDDFSCTPSRHGNNQNNATITIIYLEIAWKNMHDETFYSLINQMCSCENNNKDPYWTIPNGTIPHFYVGPAKWMSPGFQRIMQEYNDTTSCGPIFFDKPTDTSNNNKYPNLITIVTTTYADHFTPSSYKKHFKRINDPRYIFICHDDAPFLEDNATNVFFLTPRHNRYIVPSFFPPKVVQRLTSESIHQRQQQGHQMNPQTPIFLVMGQIKQSRRNLNSLVSAVKKHRHQNFTVRFMSHELQEQNLRQIFPDPMDYAKVELFSNPDSDEFMQRVAESDVVLPLVDQEQFSFVYQGGKKLASSVSWGLGFHKKMILYRPLAGVFGIEEDNVTYFLHRGSITNVAYFDEAFGRVLDTYGS